MVSTYLPTNYGYTYLNLYNHNQDKTFTNGNHNIVLPVSQYDPSDSNVAAQWQNSQQQWNINRLQGGECGQRIVFDPTRFMTIDGSNTYSTNPSSFYPYINTQRTPILGSGTQFAQQKRAIYDHYMTWANKKWFNSLIAALYYDRYWEQNTQKYNEFIDMLNNTEQNGYFNEQLQSLVMGALPFYIEYTDFYNVYYSSDKKDSAYIKNKQNILRVFVMTPRITNNDSSIYKNDKSSTAQTHNIQVLVW